MKKTKIDNIINDDLDSSSSKDETDSDSDNDESTIQTMILIMNLVISFLKNVRTKVLF